MTKTPVLALRRFIEGIKSHDLKAVIIFVDFKKAFDSIDRKIMFNIIESYGIQEVITKSILIVYADTKARVLPPGGETELFERFRGVVQGDT